VPAAGIGTASVSWTPAAAATPGDFVAFTPVLDLNGVAAGTAVNLTLTTKTAGGVILGTSVLTVDTAVTTPKVAATVSKFLTHTETQIADIATVATGFKKFSGTGTAVAATSNLAVTSILTSVPAAAAKVLVTLSGDFTAIKSISITGATGSTAAGVTTVVPGTTKGTASQMWIDNANGKAYAVATVAAGATTVTLAPIFTASGAAIPASAYTADLSLLADANYVAGAIGAAAAPVLNITRNGTTFTSNNIGPVSRIHITNNDAGPSVVTFSAVTAAGVAITQVAVPAPGTALPTTLAKGTTDIAGSDLRTAFPGAASISFNIEAANVDVTHIKKNASGLNTNVYSSKSNIL